MAEFQRRRRPSKQPGMGKELSSPIEMPRNVSPSRGRLAQTDNALSDIDSVLAESQAMNQRHRNSMGAGSSDSSSAPAGSQEKSSGNASNYAPAVAAANQANRRPSLHSDSDLRNAEDSAGDQGKATASLGADEAKLAKAGDNQKDDSGWEDNTGKDDKSGRKKGFWTRHKKAAGLTMGIGGAGIIGIGSIVGPGLAINTLRSMLLEKIANVQTSHQRKYRRSKFSKVGDMFSTDGRRGGKIIAEMESRGFRFEFGDATDKKKITAVRTPRGERLVGDEIADNLEGFIDVRHPLRTSRWKTKRMDAFYSRYKISRRSVTTRAPGDVDDPERKVNKDIIDQVDGEEVDGRAVGGRQSDGEETDQEAADREAKNQSDADYTKNNGSLDDIKNKLKDGTPLAELTDDERKILQIASRVDDEVLELLEKSVESASFGSKALSAVKGLGAADIMDKVCTAKNRIRAISFAARHYRALSLMRYAGVFIKGGDDVRRGTADPKLLNQLMKRTTALDVNGNSLGGSPGFAYIMKNKFSKSKNTATKDNSSVDGKLSGVPGSFEDAFNSVPGASRGQCAVYQNPVFQVGAAVIEIGVGFFTGGSSEAAAQGTKEAVKLAIKEGLQKLLTKQTAKALAKSILIEVSFEAALRLLQFYAEKASKLNFTGQESGGELGSILASGAGTLNKQRSLEAGMVPATATQYAMAQNQYFAELREEQKTQSFFTRVLDYNNTESLAFTAAANFATTPMSAEGVGIGVQNSVAHAASLFTNPFGLLGGIFGGSANAADEDEIPFETTEVGGDSLATDPSGNLLPIMRQDIMAVDPIENIEFLKNSGDIDRETLEPLSDSFKKHVDKCVNEVDTIGAIEEGNDCLAKQQITVRYKAHLAWRDMLDGVDASLFPEEIGTGAEQPTTTTTTGTNDTPVVGNTASTACAAGTTDLGEADGYSNKQKYRIRLCGIPGFRSSGSEDAGTGGVVRVNSTASSKWLQLFKNGQAAGITLSAASSFRSMAKQQELYNCYINNNCNGGNLAAVPGTSNHQMGFAVDIDIAVGGKDPTLTACKANPDRYPTYKWLAANAPGLGIQGRVEKECWHWSSTGT